MVGPPIRGGRFSTQTLLHECPGRSVERTKHNAEAVLAAMDYQSRNADRTTLPGRRQDIYLDTVVRCRPAHAQQEHAVRADVINQPDRRLIIPPAYPGHYHDLTTAALAVVHRRAASRSGAAPCMGGTGSRRCPSGRPRQRVILSARFSLRCCQRAPDPGHNFLPACVYGDSGQACAAQTRNRHKPPLPLICDGNAQPICEPQPAALKNRNDPAIGLVSNDVDAPRHLPRCRIPKHERRWSVNRISPFPC